MSSTPTSRPRSPSQAMPARCSGSCRKSWKRRGRGARRKAGLREQIRNDKAAYRESWYRHDAAGHRQSRALLRRAAAADAGQRHHLHRRRQPHLPHRRADADPCAEERDPADRFQLHGLCGAGGDRRQAGVPRPHRADDRRRRRLHDDLHGDPDGHQQQSRHRLLRLQRRRARPDRAGAVDSLWPQARHDHRQAQHRGCRDRHRRGLSADERQRGDCRRHQQGQRDRGRRPARDRRRAHRLFQEDRVHARRGQDQFRSLPAEREAALPDPRGRAACRSGSFAGLRCAAAVDSAPVGATLPSNTTRTGQGGTP